MVILANLSGFDGSPESLRQLQLEYGAEIGRAVVNFDGPIVFCVVSRYHGGAFVVFSATLNDNMEIAAVEGSYASVIGGAPAAAVVFAAEVRKRTSADPRVADLQAAIAEATASGAHDEASALRAKLGRPGRPCTPRSWGSSPTSSTGCTASSGPARWVRCRPSSRRRGCGPTSSTRSGAGCSGRWRPAASTDDRRIRSAPGGVSDPSRLQRPA